MPSKYNEKILRVERMNRMEKARLDIMLRRYNKEKISLVHEIEREKRAVVKDFAHVKRTSGFSEEGIPPLNERDDDFKNDPLFKIGPRLSDKRLSSAKSLRSSSARSLKQYDFNNNCKSPRYASNSSESDDDVFIDDSVILPLPDFSDPDDIDRYERELLESYKNVFKNTNVTVKKTDKKNLSRFLRSRSEAVGRKVIRPQTAKCQMSRGQEFSLPVRPATAYHKKDGPVNMVDNGFTYSDKDFSKSYTSDNSSASCSSNSVKAAEEDSENQNTVSTSVKQLIEQILEEESIEPNKLTVHIPTERIPSASSYKSKPETGILRTRRISASTNQTSDVETDGSTRFTRQTSSTGSRNRKVSINSVSVTSDFDRVSNMWGSIGDISLDSNGQRKPSNWRQYVAAENAPIPENKKLVTLSTVVKAALAFSKTARKRALDKLVEEQSVDTRQAIQQERIRRLQSRNNVLMSLSSQWSGNNDKTYTLIEEENF